MKTNNTKKALVLSTLALLLCVSMLVGTTFAWFTDSVSSVNNKIVSGNLDVELYWSETAEEDSWDKVTDQTNVFSGQLWEPGHTEVVYLKVVNEGTLALKYQLGVNIASEKGGINVDGEPFKLSDYIMFDVADFDAAAYDSREEAIADVESDATKLNTAYSKSSNLYAEGKGVSEEVVAMVVYMPTTVGNEANYKTGTNPPEINLGINLVATQYTNEIDSFGPDYDEAAPWTGAIAQPEQDENGVFQIGTAEELAWFAQYVNGTLPTTYASRAVTGHNAVLTHDIDLNNLAWTPIGRTITAEEKAAGHHAFDFQFHGNSGRPYALFDGQGHTIYNLNVDAKENAGLFGAAVYAEIKNVNVDGASIVSNHFAGTILAQGYALVDNCHVKNATVICTTELIDGEWDNGDKVGGVVGKISEATKTGVYGVTNCSAENVKVSAYRDAAGILGYAGDYASVTGNKVTNITLIQDNTHDYKNYDATEKYNINAIVGDSTRSKDVVVSNNNESGVTMLTNIAITEDGAWIADNFRELEIVLELGGEIIVTDEIDITTSLTVNKDTVITLDGGTLSSEMTSTRMFEIASGASLTLNAEGQEIDLGGYGLAQFSANVTDASLVVNGGTFTGDVNTGALVRLRAGNENINVTLNNVTADITNGWIISTAGVNVSECLTLDINGGSYKATGSGLELHNTVANISNTTISADTDWALLGSGEITITNSTIDVLTDGNNSGGVTAGLAISGEGLLIVKDSEINVTWDDSGSYPRNVAGVLVCNSGGHIFMNDTDINLIGSDEMKEYRADAQSSDKGYSITIDGETKAEYNCSIDVVDSVEDLTTAVGTENAIVQVQEGTYTFPASSIAAGTTIICDEGTVFEGKSSLNVQGATVIGATFDADDADRAATGTINGTFKDCTFTGYNGLRYCYAGETVVFENCVFDGDVYGVHFDGGANEVVFKNCTFSGFNAMGGAIEKLTLDNCTFKALGNSNYNGINLWGDTDLIDCTFVFDGSVGNEWVDLCNDNKTVTFTNCIVTDGVNETPIEEVVGDYGEGNTIIYN